MARGSIGTSHRELQARSISIDTCSGYNVVARSALPPDWKSHLAPHHGPLPRLAKADSSPLPLLGVVSLAVRFANNIYRFPFVIADSLAVDVIVGTPFIDKHVRLIDIEKRRMLFLGRQVPILPPPPPSGAESSAQTTTKSSRDSHCASAHVHPIKLSRPITIPPMSQLAAPVSSLASGLVHINPKPSLVLRHGVCATNGIHDLSPNKPFYLLLDNFPHIPRSLPKGNLVAYAECNDVPVFLSDRATGEEFGRVLNIGTLPHPSQPPPTLGISDPAAAAPAPPASTPGGTDANPPSWENELSLDHISDRGLRSSIIEMLRKHSTMWNGQLGTIRATEHRIALQPGRVPFAPCPIDRDPRSELLSANSSTRCFALASSSPPRRSGFRRLSLYQKRTRRYGSALTTAVSIRKRSAMPIHSRVWTIA